MADENKVKKLTDAEADNAAGGRVSYTDTTSSPSTKKCATPGCSRRIPISSKESYCQKCIKRLPISGPTVI